MRVAYDWTEADWNEAVTLATDGPRRRGSVPGMVYALVGIPLIGAVMDGVRSVRGTGKLTGAGMAVPLLLMLLGIALGAGVFMARIKRRRRIRSQMPMPVGQWEAVVQEAGWHFHAKAEDAAAAGVPAVERGLAEAAAEVAAVEDEVVPATAETVVAETVVAREASAPVVDVDLVAGVNPAAGSAEVMGAPPAVDVDTVLTLASPEAVAAAVGVVPVAPETASPEPLAVPVPAVPAVKRETPLQPWKELTGSRTGDRVIVFLHRGGFHAVPVRCMTPEQASHLHRMVIRKLRPAPVQPPR